MPDLVEHRLVPKGGRRLCYVSDGYPVIEITISEGGIGIRDRCDQSRRTYRPEDVSLIRCLYGGEGEAGTELRLNLDHPYATPTIDEQGAASGHPLAMPPAKISVAAGSAESIVLSPTGKGGLFYEWALTLTSSTNA